MTTFRGTRRRFKYEFWKLYGTRLLHTVFRNLRNSFASVRISWTNRKLRHADIFLLLYRVHTSKPERALSITAYSDRCHRTHSWLRIIMSHWYLLHSPHARRWRSNVMTSKRHLLETVPVASSCNLLVSICILLFIMGINVIAGQAILSIMCI
jgi:hypothetical protein